MHPMIPQIIGVAAVATFLFSYQLKRREAIIICNTLSRCLYIVQYLLLGAFSGAVLDVLGAIASVIAAKKNIPLVKKYLKTVIIIVDLTILAAGLLLCASPIDLLPIFGVLLHTSAFWLTDERWIRRVSLAGSPFWFVYNFSSAAYGSAVGDLLTMLSIFVAMIRYRAGKNNEKSA